MPTPLAVWALLRPPLLMVRAGGFQCGPSMWTSPPSSFNLPLGAVSTILRGLTSIVEPVNSPPPLTQLGGTYLVGFRTHAAITGGLK